MSRTSTFLFTIGHSNHTWERFLGLMLAHQIEVLVDVRSYPRSRFAPWSNRERLAEHLVHIGIEYLWAGDSLGGMPRGPKARANNGDRNVGDWYRARAEAADFKTAIADISRAATGKRLVVMCSEGDPTRCHRSQLLAPALQVHNVEIRHIDPKTGEIMIPFDLSETVAQEEFTRTLPN